jgi:hypothetical protein
MRSGACSNGPVVGTYLPASAASATMRLVACCSNWPVALSLAWQMLSGPQAAQGREVSRGGADGLSARRDMLSELSVSV